MPGPFRTLRWPCSEGQCWHALEPRPYAEGVASTTWRGDPIPLPGLLDRHSSRHPAHGRLRRNPAPLFVRGGADAPGSGVCAVCSIPSPAEPLGVARVRMAVFAPLDASVRETDGCPPPWAFLVSRDGSDRSFRL